MDKSLDEIVSEHQRNNAPRGRRGGRRNDRGDYPRDGVRKSTRDEPRNIDSEWVHDKYDESSNRRPYRPERRRSRDRRYEPVSAKLRVENLHYDLTEEDLEGLFARIGPVLRLSLTYDRAGRSEGVAYVTYESAQDAKTAIREFDGANAKGQPIHLTPIPGGPSAGRRNPFDSAQISRSLEDRITPASGPRDRSRSPLRRSNVSGPVPSNVDRYVPGQNGRGSRSPMPGRRDGRLPGARRERVERAASGRGNDRVGRDGRPKKTQEELDAEMEDYWGGGGATENGTRVATEKTDDIEMVE